MSSFLGGFVAEGQLALAPLLTAILEVPPHDAEESSDPPLVAAGAAYDVVFGLLTKCVLV